MAVLALVCVAYPHTELSILFLPQFTFSAGSVSTLYVDILTAYNHFFIRNVKHVSIYSKMVLLFRKKMCVWGMPLPY